MAARAAVERVQACAAAALVDAAAELAPLAQVPSCTGTWGGDRGLLRQGSLAVCAACWLGRLRGGWCVLNAVKEAEGRAGGDAGRGGGEACCLGPACSQSSAGRALGCDPKVQSQWISPHVTAGGCSNSSKRPPGVEFSQAGLEFSQAGCGAQTAPTYVWFGHARCGGQSGRRVCPPPPCPRALGHVFMALQV
eukprot:363349-Chlamydomonas_euryale.AAC.2